MKTSQVYSTRPTSRMFLRNILLLFGCSAVNWGTRRPHPYCQCVRISQDTHTHIYIYIHIHTRTYTRTYTHTYIHTHTHIHTYTYIHTHTYTHTHIHTQDETNFADKFSRPRQCKVPDNQSTKMSSLQKWAAQNSITS